MLRRTRSLDSPRLVLAVLPQTQQVVYAEPKFAADSARPQASATGQVPASSPSPIASCEAADAFGRFTQRIFAQRAADSWANPTLRQLAAAPRSVAAGLEADLADQDGVWRASLRDPITLDPLFTPLELPCRHVLEFASHLARDGFGGNLCPFGCQDQDQDQPAEQTHGLSATLGQLAAALRAHDRLTGQTVASRAHVQCDAKLGTRSAALVLAIESGDSAQVSLRLGQQLQPRTAQGQLESFVQVGARHGQVEALTTLITACSDPIGQIGLCHVAAQDAARTNHPSVVQAVFDLLPAETFTAQERAQLFVCALASKSQAMLRLVTRQFSNPLVLQR